MVEQHRPANVTSIRLRNDPDELTRLNDFVCQIANQEKLEPEQKLALDLCLEEAVTNILMYGAISSCSEEPISVSMLSGSPNLVICLEDEGKPFDPSAAPPPPATTSLDDAKIGGLGIGLIRKMTREIKYERRNNRNYLFLYFRFAAKG